MSGWVLDEREPLGGWRVRERREAKAGVGESFVG